MTASTYTSNLALSCVYSMPTSAALRAHLQVIDNCPRYVHAITDLLKGVHCVLPRCIVRTLQVIYAAVQLSKQAGETGDQVVRGYLVVQREPWTLQIAGSC